MKVHRLILLGPPASGKGTQGRLMTERWQVPVVSVGDVLRKEIADGTAIGTEAAGFMDHGNLVPDRVALAAAEVWLDKNTAGNFVFDGFPRTVGQAEALEAILIRHDLPLTAVLWLELDDASIAGRVSRRLTCADCGRSFQIGWQVPDRETDCPVCGGKLAVRRDDDPETLASRMHQYREHTEPVRAFYAARHLLRSIDAGGSPEEVFSLIERAVDAGGGSNLPAVTQEAAA